MDPSPTAEQIRQSFRELAKALRCPNCKVEFSDWACDWMEAWSEGRKDALKECGHQERDGPCKIRCELCAERSFIDYFNNTVAQDSD